MSSNNNCGCQPETEITYKKCNECTPDIPCECAVKDLSTDCILYTGDDIKCDSTTVITKNLNLSDNLKNLVAYICQGFAEVKNYLRIINVGGGAEIYAGDNLIGQKKLRTITSTDSSVTITQNTDTIDISVDGVDQNNFVRNLYINLSAIPGYDIDNPPTAIQINTYLSTLPNIQKTLAETDSKWNLVFYTLNPT